MIKKYHESLEILSTGDYLFAIAIKEDIQHLRFIGCSDDFSKAKQCALKSWHEFKSKDSLNQDIVNHSENKPENINCFGKVIIPASGRVLISSPKPETDSDKSINCSGRVLISGVISDLPKKPEPEPEKEENNSNEEHLAEIELTSSEEPIEPISDEELLEVITSTDGVLVPEKMTQVPTRTPVKMSQVEIPKKEITPLKQPSVSPQPTSNEKQKMHSFVPEIVAEIRFFGNLFGVKGRELDAYVMGWNNQLKSIYDLNDENIRGFLTYLYRVAGLKGFDLEEVQKQKMEAIAACQK